jgi:division protein CdvB (Snf7/Vps24/ESCRT-III family)
MTLAKVQQAQSRLRAVSVRQQEARLKLREAIQEARKTHTLAEIGQVLGMTRQGVHDLLKRR